VLTRWSVMRFRVVALGVALLGLQVHAGDAESVLQVRIGAGLKELGANVSGLKPDVCLDEEKGWYQANGWSCEGYVKEGIQVSGVELRARFRMAGPKLRVANVTLAGEVATREGRASSSALVDACDSLMGALSKTYGRGDTLVMDKREGSVRYVVFYGSKSLGEAATMVCQDNRLRGTSELVVDIVPSDGKTKPLGLLASR